MMGPRLAGMLIIAAVLLTASRAEAACTVSTTGVNFGSYDVFSAVPTDSTGGVTYRCDLVTLTLSIELSTGSSGSFASRTLTSGADSLNYNLYCDAANLLVWGDGTGGTCRHTAVLPVLLTNFSITVFARIPAGQDVAAGTYSDSIVVTILF